MAADPTKLKVAKDVGRTDVLFHLARMPGTSRVFVGSSDFKLYELDLQAEKPEAKEVGSHSSYVTSVALAGKSLVSGSYDCKLSWWDIDSGKAIRSVDGHTKRVRMIVASPDGKLVASVADDMICKLWNVADGKMVRELKGHDVMTPHHYPSMLYAAAFSRDGKLLATGDKTGKVCVWNVADGKQLGTLDASGVYTWDPTQRRHSIGGIRSLAFSPDGKRIVVGGMGKVGNIDHPDAPGRLEVFEWPSAKKLYDLQTESKLKGMFEQLAFNDDGSWLVGAGGGYAGFIAFIDVNNGKIIFQDTAPMHVHGLSLAESGDTIYASGHNKLVRWEMKA
jgi:WD40 repeat protein